ncbi:TPA: hypothetical protein VDV84_001451 [Pseudomonas aeruginosa]|uniref:Uncharacterized protein n=3 Tax=Pseudomonas aeruginosa TaxID=287 RepID=A0A0H2Z609_PSEAB|nr:MULTISPECIES: hypothetical protein [Pseudomonas]SAJ33004.1 Uncharacterised protein [Enterobacter cloacae]DAL14719.1 MAG TPA_asm: hypothetical protein [Caudoviricetes sp.]ABJ09981.1 hypothetical protein PA14_53600 [Pseudomonas aeruginosa UCBPP-PA14]ARH13605.1 hypothetical protein HW04_30515 [Pseudomonas aeruginosa]ASM87301.1 hypothetical protein BWR11_23805 [Pseudomonas aeruginosa]
MKIIEPLSSALLVTGCVYASGIAQNSAFMRVFGVNPIFSQPAIDKIFYDGGIITFEIFSTHLIVAAIGLISLLSFIIFISVAISIKKHTNVSSEFLEIAEKIECLVVPFGKISGLCILTYLIVLTLLSYNKAKVDGEEIALSFVHTCHKVVIEKGKERVDGCAFNKDRDSIWYYTLDGGEPKANAKPLSEIDRIIYLDPETQ